ncbi:MAG: DNA-processing protein DprA [Protaetiibacter sp.]
MTTITTEQHARAAWAAIAEPADKQAAAAIRTLGGDVALTLLRTSPAALMTHLTENGSDPDQAAAAIARWIPRSRAGDSAVEDAERNGVHLVTPDHPHWPTQLDDLGDEAPWALFAKGDTSHLLHRGPIVLTGARASTGYGEHVATQLASGLVDRGYAIASGAAYGIDGHAHRGALAADGVTMAFTAGGLDRFYPAGNAALLDRIATEGVAVSPVPCGTAPTRWRFMARARVMAAFGAATVIVEAGARSGSLHAAGAASALRRPVGAVPGSVTSAASAGSHILLRDHGAACVTSAADIADLAPLPEMAA